MTNYELKESTLQDNGTSTLQLNRTDTQTVWELTVPDRAPYLFVDTLADTALLRHRPDVVSSVSWFLVDRTSLKFSVPQRRARLPLSEAVESISSDPETGFKILSKTMEAVEIACDHLLPIIPTLLHPDLISIKNIGGEREDFHVQIVTLPLGNGNIERGQAQQNLGLIQWMGNVFHWDTLLITRLAELFDRGALFDLLLEAKTLCGEPYTPIRNTTESLHRQRSERPSSPLSALQEKKASDRSGGLTIGNSWKKRITARLKQLGQALFGLQTHEMVHEVTEELDLSSDHLKIAQLSEGLPGTPDEELGHHAYILTDEFVIGRDMSRSDFWIDSFSISRRHAVIRRRARGYFVEDLGSKNGTILDGVKLIKHREHLLPDKCKISFADHVYYFRSA